MQETISIYIVTHLQDKPVTYFQYTYKKNVIIFVFTEAMSPYNGLKKPLTF